MNTKWYFSALVVLLAFFGANQEHAIIPNQEIVLQFTGNQITQDDTQNAVTIVKKKLNALGVFNIQVQNLKDGSLKIVYYSDSHVELIKKAISSASINLDESLSANDSYPLPLDKNTNHYDVDVYEIQQSKDGDSGLGGQYVLELKYEYDRLINSNNPLSFSEVTIKSISETLKVEFKVNRNIAIAIDNWSHHIPEVRAGPTYC